MIVKIDYLERPNELRKITSLIDVAIHKQIAAGIENVQLTADIIEGGGFGRIGHDRCIAERCAVVFDYYTLGIAGGQAVTSFATIQRRVGAVAAYDAPFTGDFYVGCKAADGQHSRQGVRVAGNIDRSNGVPERVGHIQRIAVSTER